MMKYIKKIAAAVVACGVIGLCVGAVIPVTTQVIENRQKPAVSDDVALLPSESDADVRTTMDEASQNTVEIIKKVQPSIACITTITEGISYR